MPKTNIVIGCPMCDQGSLTVTLYYDHGSRYDPPERGAEIKSQDGCTCAIPEDYDLYEHAASIAADGPDDEYEGPDTLEEARGER